MEIISKYSVQNLIANFKLLITVEILKEVKVDILVYNGACLNHKIDCPNCVSNFSQTKDPMFISKQIIPLFEEKSPSLNEIKRKFSQENAAKSLINC